VKLTDPDGKYPPDHLAIYSGITDGRNTYFPPLNFNIQNTQTIQNISPLTQTSTELSDIPNMAASGCYFRSAQAVAEFYLGVELTSEQIHASVTALQATPDPAHPGSMVIDSYFNVSNPDLVINDAFERLGHSDLTGTVGWNGTPGEQDYIIREGQVPGANQHFTLHDNEGNLLFDPRPDITTTNPTNRNVYVHGD
jgi:hypothetical protein